ncbi:hypothetical protein S83_022238 [Arachis hypogaea]
MEMPLGDDLESWQEEWVAVADSCQIDCSRKKGQDLEDVRFGANGDGIGNEIKMDQRLRHRFHVQLPMILESRVKDALGFKDISKFKIKIFLCLSFFIMNKYLIYSCL